MTAGVHGGNSDRLHPFRGLLTLNMQVLDQNVRAPHLNSHVSPPNDGVSDVKIEVLAPNDHATHLNGDPFALNNDVFDPNQKVFDSKDWV